MLKQLSEDGASSEEYVPKIRAYLRECEQMWHYAPSRIANKARAQKMEKWYREILDNVTKIFGEERENDRI